MIKANVGKSHVTCKIEGRGTTILSELTILVDSILDKLVDDDEELKKTAVDEFCNCLHEIN